MASYNTLDVDLSVTVDPPTLILATRGKLVESVTVLTLPSGELAFLRFGGTDKDPIAVGVGYRFRPCPPEKDGVFLAVPAGGAGTMRLLLSFADPESDRGGLTVDGA